MLCRYYLIVGSHIVDTGNKENCIDATDMIRNWSEIKTSYDRVDLGAVVLKCGSRFEFLDKARELLIKEYRTKYLQSRAAIAIYVIENNWTYPTKTFECPLDFSAFTWDNHLAYISCVDSSAAALINANKGTQYEFPVSELKDASALIYDGVKVRNEVTYEISGASVEGESYSKSQVLGAGYCIWIPPFYKVKEDLAVNSSVELHDQEEALTAKQTGGWEGWFGSEPNTNTSSYFLECMVDCVVSLDFTNIRIWGYNAGMAPNPYDLGLIFQLYKIPESGLPTEIDTQMPTLRGTEHDYYCELKGDYPLVKGEKLQLVVRRFALNNNIGIGDTDFYMSNDSGKISWNGIASPISIDVITPLSLLNRLLLSMSDTLEIRGEIRDTINGVENTRLKNTMLVAAESIRDISNAKIYSSFGKFCDFMEAEFGYVYSVAPCYPSESETPDVVLKDCIEFDGFFDFESVDYVETVAPDGTAVQVKYTEMANYGGMFFGFANNICYFSWPGCEKYQDYGDYYTTSLRTKVTYRDNTCGIYYKAKEKHLVEFELDRISTKNYTVIARFGGFTVATADSGSYTIEPDIANILFSRMLSKFLYFDGTAYYSVFPGSDNYNSDDRPRKDSIFVNVRDTELHDDGQVYVVVNDTDLVKYKGSVPVLVKYDEAALVTFKHRSEVFKSTIIKRIELYTAPEYKVADDRIYSELQIGYEKQDYDYGNNGYDEFNFTNRYTTGVTLKNATLSLICPYRADCYGFEELAEKRGTDTSSTGSDTHIFLVNVLPYKIDDKYKVSRLLKIQGAYTDTVFNAVYAPMFMIEANRGYIGMFARRLTFASSDGNSDIIIDGKKMNADVKITDRILTCGDISIKTNNVVLPTDWEGIICFEWEDYLFRCFLKSVDANFSRNEAFEYNLMEESQVCMQ